MLRWSLGILALCVACGSSSVKPEQAKPAALVVDRSSVQFATVSPSETSAEASVRISNDGGTPTAALVTNLDGRDAGAFIVTSDGCRAIVLAPAATCDVHVAFRPSAEGQFSAELRVASDAAAATVALSGAAKFVPAVTVTLDGRSVAGGTGTLALDQGTSCNAICSASAQCSRSGS